MDGGVLRIASKVVWWLPPEEVVRRQDDFLCRVMTLANWVDVKHIERTYGEEALRAALRHATPGVFDQRSWHYWHRRLGLGPAGPLPARHLP